MPLTLSKSTDTAVELTKAVRAFHAEHRCAEVIPPGWVSAVQYAAVVGEPVHITRLFLDRRESTGYVKTKTFRTAGRDGMRRAVKHYFIKSQSKIT